MTHYLLTYSFNVVMCVDPTFACLLILLQFVSVCDLVSQVWVFCHLIDTHPLNLLIYSPIHIPNLVLTMSLTLLSVDQIADLSSHFKPDGPADKKSKKMQDEKTARQTAQGDLSITIHYYTMCSLNCLSGYIDMIYSHSHIFSILLLSLLLL